MTIKEDKHRFVVIIEKELFEQFKFVAGKEKRSASNLTSKLIANYAQKNIK